MPGSNVHVAGFGGTKVSKAGRIWPSRGSVFGGRGPVLTKVVSATGPHIGVEDRGPTSGGQCWAGGVGGSPEEAMF